MPTVLNDGIRIYYETQGRGDPVVLMHGLAMKGDSWRLGGYVEPLAERHKVVLIDARGHGSSDKPALAEAYDPAKRAGDVRAVLDDLGIQEAKYFGMSMGGQIGFDLCLICPERISLFVIGAAAIVPPSPNAAPITEQMIEGLASAALTRDYPAPDERRQHSKNLRQNDASALDAVRIANAARDFDQLKAAVTGLDAPMLFYAGTDDPRHDAARELASNCRNARFVSLQGLDHVRSFFEVDKVLPHVLEFLADGA